MIYDSTNYTNDQNQLNQSNSTRQRLLKPQIQWTGRNESDISGNILLSNSVVYEWGRFSKLELLCNTTFYFFKAQRLENEAQKNYLTNALKIFFSAVSNDVNLFLVYKKVEDLFEARLYSTKNKFTNQIIRTFSIGQEIIYADIYFMAGNMLYDLEHVSYMSNSQKIIFDKQEKQDK